jgi:hypothetical protein
MGCRWSKLGYNRIDAGSVENTRLLLKEAFAAVTSSHVPSGYYFIFPSGSIVRLNYRNDCMLSKMEEVARSKLFPIQPGSLEGVLSEAVLRGAQCRRTGVYVTPESAFSPELERYLLRHSTKGVKIVEINDCVNLIGVFDLEAGPPSVGHVVRCIEEDIRSDNVLDVHILHNS